MWLLPSLPQQAGLFFHGPFAADEISGSSACLTLLLHFNDTKLGRAPGHLELYGKAMRICSEHRRAHVLHATQVQHLSLWRKEEGCAEHGKLAGGRQSVSGFCLLWCGGCQPGVRAGVPGADVAHPSPAWRQQPAVVEQEQMKHEYMSQAWVETAERSGLRRK